MNSSEAFLNFHQILSRNISDRPDDFHRPCRAHIARNSSNNISHITIEFAGPRAKFLSVITFDGSGDMGTRTTNLFMPKVKLDPLPRALSLLTCMDYLISIKHLDATMDYFYEVVSFEVSRGTSQLKKRYEDLCAKSHDYIQAHEAGEPLPVLLALSAPAHVK
jgi:hypothetical protein